jgi:hypothetical protein
VTEEQVGEEAADLALDGGHRRGVDGRNERGDADAAQHPVRGQRQDEANGRVHAGQRSHEQQGDAERAVLEPVDDPAVGRHGAAADQDGGQQQDGRPAGRRPRVSTRFHQGPAEDEQADVQGHVQDVHAGGPAAVDQLGVGRQRAGRRQARDDRELNRPADGPFRQRSAEQGRNAEQGHQYDRSGDDDHSQPDHQMFEYRHVRIASCRTTGPGGHFREHKRHQHYGSRATASTRAVTCHLDQGRLVLSDQTTLQSGHTNPTRQRGR